MSRRPCLANTPARSAQSLSPWTQSGAESYPRMRTRALRHGPLPHPATRPPSGSILWVAGWGAGRCRLETRPFARFASTLSLAAVRHSLGARLRKAPSEIRPPCASQRGHHRACRSCKTTLVASCSVSRDVPRQPACCERAMDSNDSRRARITILAKCTSSTGMAPDQYRRHPRPCGFRRRGRAILSMVDGVILLVDAAEGPMPQTKFVTAKALALG